MFQKDLQHMMYGFGDDPNPLPETVALVEDIVVEYIIDLAHKAQEFASKRGKLLTEDFLYLMRKRGLTAADASGGGEGSGGVGVRVPTELEWCNSGLGGKDLCRERWIEKVKHWQDGTGQRYLSKLCASFSSAQLTGPSSVLSTTAYRSVFYSARRAKKEDPLDDKNTRRAKREDSAYEKSSSTSLEGKIDGSCLSIAEHVGLWTAARGTNFVFSPLSIHAALTLLSPAAYGKLCSNCGCSSNLLPTHNNPHHQHPRSGSVQLV
ncbi:hypothetical protein HPP92_025205 [Vanilla planifolia]|uniref:Transcription initiation factor TFIID subunit 13 n=1 Tax=Vanilla planifolia TaxID=51239 RepID=A0A835PKJ1_VANPL|nr:hypothetical protein HPP92_025205 [Vanilla planifolia]